MNSCTAHTTKEGNVLFNDTLNTFKSIIPISSRYQIESIRHPLHINHEFLHSPHNDCDSYLLPVLAVVAAAVDAAAAVSISLPPLLPLLLPLHRPPPAAAREVFRPWRRRLASWLCRTRPSLDRTTRLARWTAARRCTPSTAPPTRRSESASHADGPGDHA